MSFIKSKKRKVRAATKEMEIPSVNLTGKYIFYEHGIADFERLYFKGCPVLPIEGKSIPIPKGQGDLVDAGRRLLVNRIYLAVEGVDKSKRTKVNIFNALVNYIRLMDESGVDEPFSTDGIKLYVEYLKGEYRKGVKGKTLSIRQGLIKNILKEISPSSYNDCCDLFYMFPNDVEHVKPYTDLEVSEIATALNFIYENYSSHFIDGTVPNVFPLYPDSEIKGVEKFKLKDKRKHRRSVSYRTNRDVWKTDLSRVAYFLTCLYTGVNSSSLLDIKLSDIEEEPFKSVNRKIYKLRSVKGRQGGKVNYIDVGFGKKAKTFLESWISISKGISKGARGAYLFPVVINGECRKMTTTSASNINSVLVDFGLPALTSGRFRKTKSSLIMRSTESIFMVAKGLNNKVETAAKYYSEGDSVTTEFSLASALYVREKVARGGSLDEVMSESSYLFKDPLREKYLKGNEKKLLNGLRCKVKYEDKSKKLKDILIKENLAKESDVVTCYKFLECFGCKFHAVVAEVDDVWLLLSFNDVILQAATRPSINSTPSKVLDKVNNTLQIIMDKMKIDHAEVYNEAYSKYLNGPHPLWEDKYDLDLIGGVY